MSFLNNLNPKSNTELWFINFKLKCSHLVARKIKKKFILIYIYIFFLLFSFLTGLIFRPDRDSKMGEENYFLPHVKQQKIYKYITNTEILPLLSTCWIPCYSFEKVLFGWHSNNFKRLSVQEGEDICMPMTDSCWYMAETNTIL